MLVTPASAIERSVAHLSLRPMKHLLNRKSPKPLNPKPPNLGLGFGVKGLGSRV